MWEPSSARSTTQAGRCRIRRAIPYRAAYRCFLDVCPVENPGGTGHMAAAGRAPRVADLSVSSSILEAAGFHLDQGLNFPGEILDVERIGAIALYRLQVRVE